MNFENYIDISPLISSDIAVFPGDQPFERKEIMSCDQGDHLTLSSINTTVHLGAHADGPNHYAKNSPGIDGRDLTHYMGDCQVIDARHSQNIIKKSDIDLTAVKSKRILFRTDSFKNPNQWQDDFKSLHPELIDALALKKVITVGIDTPSIDPASSKDLQAHQMVLRHSLAILEGLTLQSVSEGFYNLVALPLKLKDCDASPVRAILLKIK